jgi:hypothetical protein
MMQPLLILALAILPRRDHAFTFPKTSSILPPACSRTSASRFTTFKHFSSRDSSSVIEHDAELLQSIRSLRAKEIKTELEALNISTANVLEKEELVQQLYRARTAAVENADVKTKKKKKRRQYGSSK